MISYLLNRFLPKIRVKDQDNPRLGVVFGDRYMFMTLDSAKLTRRSSNELIRRRDLSKDFSTQAKGRLAVIIPFRKREEHLKQLVPRLRETLNNQEIDFHIFVVNQSDEKPFNRAKLINIGFDFSKQQFDYFCMHDVDLLPVDASYLYPSLPLRPTGFIRTSEGERKISKSNLGGVLIINKEQFLVTNGMSNNFWHWGKEDDNLLYRLLSMGINPVVDIKGIFDEIDGSTDRFNVVAGDRVVVDRKAARCFIAANKKYQDRVTRGIIPACDEGLSTLNYKVLEEIKYDSDLTVIKVSL